MFRVITEIPNPRTWASDPSSASDIIDNVDIIGVMKVFTICWNIGFSLSQSATVGANE